MGVMIKRLKGVNVKRLIKGKAKWFEAAEAGLRTHLSFGYLSVSDSSNGPETPILVSD